ncbi:hypothetical protein GGR50DRAFT_699011 [Xylaria sp. CBS 124048]|nr:hypothetical protein GGR50DRAFT_699011 [Xylaria sp. CBS 124048]
MTATVSQFRPQSCYAATISFTLLRLWQRLCNLVTTLQLVVTALIDLPQPATLPRPRSLVTILQTRHGLGNLATTSSRPRHSFNCPGHATLRCHGLIMLPRHGLATLLRPRNAATVSIDSSRPRNLVTVPIDSSRPRNLGHAPATPPRSQ